MESGTLILLGQEEVRPDSRGRDEQRENEQQGGEKGGLVPGSEHEKGRFDASESASGRSPAYRASFHQPLPTKNSQIDRKTVE